MCLKIYDRELGEFQLTYRAGYGEAHEAAHENAVVKLAEEVTASIIQRQKVLKERVSQQVPVQVASKRHLEGFTSRQTDA